MSHEDWIDEASRELNQKRDKQKTLAKLAPTFWQNIARAIEATFQHYRALDEQPVEFSGVADHTIWVAVYEPGPKRERGPERERERVTITFHQQQNRVEVRSPSESQSFPIDLDDNGAVCLRHEGRVISIPEFTKKALRKAFFPDL